MKNEELEPGEAQVPSPLRNVELSAVPVPNLAVPTVPVAKLLAFRFVRPEPLPVGVR
jgi:hypothetical protein